MSTKQTMHEDSKTGIPGFDIFLKASDVHGMKAAVISLQRTKSLVAASREPSFALRLRELEAVAVSGPPRVRLEALALLFRIGAGVKALRPEMQAVATKISNLPSASPQALEDPDDRRYFGEALRFAFGDWKRRYLSDAVIEEVAGEEARAAFMVGLVLETVNIASALRALGESFDAWSVATKDVGASRVRRLVRVATALKNSIIELDPPPGDDLGQALVSFARAALGGEQINDRDLQVQTSAAFLELLSIIVRFHFSLASEVETFELVMLLRRWFRSRGWPSKLDNERSFLARQITEALVLLAKQGIADDGLRRTLHMVLSESEATAQLSHLASQLAGIPSDLRSWLVSGQRNSAQLPTSDAVDETVLRTVDREIADSFRDAADIESAIDRLEDDFIAAVGSYEPKLVPSATRLFSTVRRVSKRIKSIATRRSMRFGSSVGEAVEFNPVDHEPLAEGNTDRIVKIKRPSVERAIDGMPPAVVLKAEIENLK